MSKHIQPLTRIDGTNAHTALGMVIDSGRPGPALLVTGFSASTLRVYDRLAELPSISHLRGRLTLMHLDRLGEAGNGPEQLRALVGPQDDSLFLPFLPDDRLSPKALAQASDEDYWTILAKMAALGMISGRGVNDRRIIALRAEMRA